MGAILAICQTKINEIGYGGCEMGTWIALIVSTFLLLFIRGYFADGFMKLAYTLAAAWVATSFVRHLGRRAALRGSSEGVSA